MKIFLLSILIAGWDVDCSPFFENFPGWGGDVPPVPPGAAAVTYTSIYQLNVVKIYILFIFISRRAWSAIFLRTSWNKVNFLFQHFLEKFCFIIVVIWNVSSVMNNYCKTFKGAVHWDAKFCAIIVDNYSATPIFTPLSVQTTSVGENYLSYPFDIAASK